MVGHHTRSDTHRLRKVLLVSMLTWLLAACNIGNTAPQIQFIPDQQINVSDGLRVTLTGQDPDGDALEFSVTGLPGEARVIPKRLQFRIAILESTHHRYRPWWARI